MVLVGEETADCAGDVGWGRLYALGGGCEFALDDAEVWGWGVR